MKIRTMPDNKNILPDFQLVFTDQHSSMHITGAVFNKKDFSPVHLLLLLIHQENKSQAASKLLSNRQEGF